MKKKIVKGFTLIELIIVLAIFSVVMAIVMSFIQPVTNLMKSASIKERTASYVDNISDYIRDSIHYAKFIYVFDGGIVDQASQTTKVDELTAVKKFVESNFNGAVDSHGDPLTGKVRVLKLINTDQDMVAPEDNTYVVSDPKDPTLSTPLTLDGGKLYESIYDFKAGDSLGKVKTDPVITAPYSTSSPAIVDRTKFNRLVANEEHFENYSFYYALGFHDLKTTNGVSELAPMTYDDGGTETEMQVNATAYNFSLSVVAYQKGKMSYTPAGSPQFEKPANIQSVSMSLVNALNAASVGSFSYYRKVYDGEGNQKKNGSKLLYEQSSVGAPYRVIPPDSSIPKVGNDIYIIYVIPSEINDYVKVY